MTYSLKAHELADEFPRITDVEFDELVASIKAEGVRERIVIHDGLILDGRNRYAAAEKAGLDEQDVPRRMFNPATEGSPESFVLDTNIHRRHLTKSQIGFIVQRFAVRGEGRPNCAPGAQLPPSAAEIAEQHGISRRTLVQAKKVDREGSDELKAAVRDGKLELKTAEKLATRPKEEQDAAIKEAEDTGKQLKNVAAVHVKRAMHESVAQGNRLADPDGVQYDVCIADPPWKYENEDVNGAASKHYPNMTIRQICEWSPVAGVETRDLFAKNAVLFLWTTVNNVWRRGLAYDAVASDELAGNARDVADAWGFPDFHGCFAWVKPHFGVGYWTRNKYEHLAIFTRGKFPAPPTDAVPVSVLQGPDWLTTTHSTKPGETYRLIERMTPGDYRRVEFFARSSAPGWKGFGNQVPSQK